MSENMRPHHHMRRGKCKPRGFGAFKCSSDEIELMERESLDVFSRMTMNGHTFVEALASVYLTGFNDALGALKEQ